MRLSKEAEQVRLNLLCMRELPYWEQGLMTCGMDEVGRGPLAGPVVAACVVMPIDSAPISGVNDSKKLSEKQRNMANSVILDTALSTGIAYVDESVIDEENILNATRQAFTKAFDYATQKVMPSVAFLDYITGVNLNIPMEILIHGDELSYSIAAASIVAKVARDSYMMRMDELYPQYGFARNKGYGTAEHINALRKFGPCPIHRKSFIKKYC